MVRNVPIYSSRKLARDDPPGEAGQKQESPAAPEFFQTPGRACFPRRSSPGGFLHPLPAGSIPPRTCGIDSAGYRYAELPPFLRPSFSPDFFRWHYEGEVSPSLRPPRGACPRMPAPHTPAPLRGPPLPPLRGSAPDPASLCGVSLKTTSIRTRKVWAGKDTSIRRELKIHCTPLV